MGKLCGFHCRKWTIFTISLIWMFLILIVIIVALFSVEFFLSNLENLAENEKDKRALKNMSRGVIYSFIIVVGIIGILCNLPGLIGSYKENYCLSVTFALIMILVTLLSIVSAFKQPSGWIGVVINIVITILAILFVRDLRQRSRSPYPMAGEEKMVCQNRMMMVM